jgi:NADH:ubiquinone oxidoreductase subunit 6 (subunit J)
MTDQAFFIILFSVGLVVSSLIVLLTKRLIVMITVLGMGSLFLSIVFFLFDAPFAGAFEVSVGAGLISVLFVIATSLTRETGGTDKDVS